MQNILRAIEYAYDKEPYRIKDLIHHVSEGQIASKTWLLEKLRPEGSTVVLGGWYGYLADRLKCRSIDLDPGCKEYGQMLYPDVEFQTKDMFNYLMGCYHQTYICTSCEHLPQEDLDVINYVPGLWCLQSNNYDIPEHINMKATLEEFKADYNWSEILYEGELDRGKYKRWMVIGRIS